MILVDNRNVLRLKNRGLLNQLTAIENDTPSGNVIVEDSKTGIPTLKIVIDGRTQYVHSKYDPEKDAERFVSKFKGETYKHVLFVGAGLGYHISKFVEAHPDAKFSIYEPDEEALLAYLAHAKLNELPIQNLLRFFVGTDTNHITNEMHEVLQLSNGSCEVVTLPVYEKIYGEQIDVIMKKSLEMLKDKTTIYVTSYSFQKRWTINSIKNFPKVLQTPNILHDVDKSAFEGKPAIIVAAGPSLNEEFENLRYIKEHGLAYIFSVGSAINALIEHEIYPDAACTYDPTAEQWLVIQKIKDNEITDIPLIFGSSVGFETLENYPGKMLHMITSQDTISPRLLHTNQELDFVVDAPSIAVVTFQLLTKLKSDPIILVGQNLAFQDNKRYAAGIEYDFVENELNEQEQKATLIVKDVYGKEIQTDESFVRMRQQLELYISTSTESEVINTTKGGAQIEGTSFVPLDELILNRLNAKSVQVGWATKVTNGYELEAIKKDFKIITRAEKECEAILESAFSLLRRMNNVLNLRQSRGLDKYFNEVDNEFNKLGGNVYFKTFLEPMVRVQYKLLSEESQRIRFESDGLKKAEIIVHAFTSFLVSVFKELEFVKPYFEEMKLKVEEVMNDKEIGWGEVNE